MKSGSAFFNRVTRFIGSEYRDPAEDRLTQITSVVLERVPGLARSLTLGWLHPELAAIAERATSESRSAWLAIADLPVDAAVATRTQVPVPGRIVDLELRFHSGSSALASDIAAVVWVEVKHGTPPSRGQLADYADLRPAYPGAVVLLSPRANPRADPMEYPEGVPERTWQATAHAARRFRRSGPADDPVAGWLLDEWLNYLRTEGLMPLEALGPEHMTALVRYNEAEAALPYICEAAMLSAPREN